MRAKTDAAVWIHVYGLRLQRNHGFLPQPMSAGKLTKEARNSFITETFSQYFFCSGKLRRRNKRNFCPKYEKEKPFFQCMHGRSIQIYFDV